MDAEKMLEKLTCPTHKEQMNAVGITSKGETVFVCRKCIEWLLKEK